MHTSMPSRLSANTYLPSHLDPISVFFDTTMPGGTALIGGTLNESLPSARFSDFVAVRAEVILEYEQTIAELRKQLLHYRSLVSQLLGPVDTNEEYEQSSAVIPIDPTSVRVINSIVNARVPSTATFRDFDEGEL